MGPLSSVRLVAAYFRANMQRALEYRASLAADAMSMLINDAMLLVFWTAFFERYPVVSGWGRDQIVTLWAVVGAGFGVATTVCGNAIPLPGLVIRGDMDVFLTLPRPVLLHALISRMSLTAWGDVVFGALAFGLFAHPSALDCVLFAFLVLSNAALFVGFAVLVGSLPFWVGSTEGFSQQAINVLVTFATHPSPIFRGPTKVLLFTVLPAGFLGFVPVEILRAHLGWWLLGHGAVSAASLAGGARVFARGLARYESGNLLITTV